MQVQMYLQNKLKSCSSYELTEDDKNFLAKEGIEAYIYRKLTSKKFRKYKMTDSSVAHTKASIQKCVRANKPLSVFYPQGAYKLWHLPSTPEVDWSEFFTIAYVVSYIAPIVAAYKPGVDLKYFFHTFLMKVHGNLTEQEIQTYDTSFEKLLVEFRKYLPQNVTITIVRDRDIYSWDEYRQELEEIKRTVEKEFLQWPKDKKESLAKTARLNIKWLGAEDWTKLSKKEQEEKMRLALLYEDSVPRMKKLANAVKSEGNILLFNKAGDNFIGIGTTKTSIVKYWVGYGVLEKREETFADRILSPEQLHALEKTPHTTEAIHLIDLQNFKTIDMYPALNFTQTRP